MSNMNRNIKKQRLMDKIERDFDRYSHIVNQRDYMVKDLLMEFYVDDAPWLVKKRPQKVGIFKGNKPRVK